MKTNIKLETANDFLKFFKQKESTIIKIVQKELENLEVIKSPNGSNLLHWACYMNMYNLVKYLVNTDKFDLTTTNTDSYNAFHFACFNNSNLEVIKYLIETNKLLIETKKFKLTAKNNDGDNALHLACWNDNANLEFIKFLVESQAFDLTAKNKNGDNALHIACKNNSNLEVIKYLIETKNFTLTETNTIGNNAFHIACRYNTNLEVIKYLIETEKFALNATNKNDTNALHFACLNNTNLEVIKLLIATNEFNLNATNNEGDNALYLACSNNTNLEVIKYLIKTNKFELNAGIKDGNSALHIACRNNTNPEVIKFLIETNKFDLTETNKNGTNALHFACISSNLEVIKYLIETNKFDVNATNNDDNSALHFACFNNTNFEVIKYLIEKGSNPNLINKEKHSHLDIIKAKNQFNYNKGLEYTEAAEFADSLISTKIKNLESRYLDPELCTGIKELIINRIKNKIYNLTGKDNLKNLFKDYIEANEFLAENRKLLKLKECNNFNDLTPNTHVPSLQMQILKKYNESYGNKIPLTKKQFAELFQNKQLKCLDELSNEFIFDTEEKNNVEIAGENTNNINI